MTTAGLAAQANASDPQLPPDVIHLQMTRLSEQSWVYRQWYDSSYDGSSKRGRCFLHIVKTLHSLSIPYSTLADLIGSLVAADLNYVVNSMDDSWQCAMMLRSYYTQVQNTGELPNPFPYCASAQSCKPSCSHCLRYLHILVLLACPQLTITATHSLVCAVYVCVRSGDGGLYNGNGVQEQQDGAG